MFVGFHDYMQACESEHSKLCRVIRGKACRFHDCASAPRDSSADSALFPVLISATARQRRRGSARQPLDPQFHFESVSMLACKHVYMFTCYMHKYLLASIRGRTKRPLRGTRAGPLACSSQKGSLPDGRTMAGARQRIERAFRHRRISQDRYFSIFSVSSDT